MHPTQHNIHHIIFDLDGTLIDSSPSILAAFKGAFLKAHLQPVKPLTPDIIGPPLKETLKNLLGENNAEIIEQLAEFFKESYDTEGYKQTQVFAGVEHLLAELSKTKPLYIATNKRIKPTLLIMEYLGWQPYFKGVYALDMPEAAAKNKAELIAYVLKTHAIITTEAIYIGDRVEDKKAALANGLNFCYAKWGYDAEADADNSVQGFEVPEQMLVFFEKGFFCDALLANKQDGLKDEKDNSVLKKINVEDGVLESQVDAKFTFIISPTVTIGIDIRLLAHAIKNMVFRKIRMINFESPITGFVFFPCIHNPKVVSELRPDIFSYRRKDRCYYLGLNIPFNIWEMASLSERVSLLTNNLIDSLNLVPERHLFIIERQEIIKIMEEVRCYLIE